VTFYDGTNAPTLLVEVDLGKKGMFILGTSPLGGTDVLGTSIPTDWQALPITDIRSISIRRGRTREDQAVQPGQLTFVMDNRSGVYDPDSTTGSYVWNGYTMLTRGLNIRVSATWITTKYYLFTGFMEMVDTDVSLDPVVTFTAVDGMAKMALAYAGIYSKGNGSSTSLYTNISNNISRGLTGQFNNLYSPMDVPASGGYRPSVGFATGQTCLKVLEMLAANEFGIFFIGSNGVPTFRRYEDRLTSPFVLTLSDTRATGTIEYDEIVTSPGAKYLVNSVNLIDGNSLAYTYDSADSQARYGLFNKDVVTYLSDPTDAQGITNIIGDYYALPQTRVSSVGFDAVGLPGIAWTQVLGSDLADKVSVERTTVDGRTRLYPSIIESVSHDITPMNWRVGLELSPVPVTTTFTLGTSTLGGTATLWY